MTSKNLSEQKAKSKYTRCETCRQDILTEKMFLHEGFCSRNNVYCEHCEKVFLKTDYEEHLKDLRNSISNSVKSTEIDETECIPVIHEIEETITTVVNPITQYEFVQMPLTEEYTINSPIVISERGNILSSQNYNEFILPFLGINSASHNYGIEYGQKDFYSLINSRNDFNSSYNYDVKRNDIKTQMNFLNKNENYHFNNYQINLNTTNNEAKIEPVKEIKKKEKLPSDNSSNKTNMTSKNICNSERIIKMPKDTNKEKITSNKNEIRITNIKKMKSLGSPKRIQKNMNIKNLKKSINVNYKKKGLLSDEGTNQCK